MSTQKKIRSVSTTDFHARKDAGEKIALLTAYDFPSAQLVDAAGVDAVLVGDSLGMVMMGQRDTLGVTVEDIIHHTKMVRAGVQHAMLIADMPFLSYQITPSEAVRHAGRLMAEGGADAVKVEGPARFFAPAYEAMLNAGIPLMGHLGLTPQSVHKFGGFKVQGRGEEAQNILKSDALALQEMGFFSIVLECIPATLAGEITRSLHIPTIGIGAGPETDGQILVMHDLLGWGKTRFAKQYADVRATTALAFQSYVEEVKSGNFPTAEHTYS